MGVRTFDKEKVNHFPEQNEMIERILDIIYEYDQFSTATAVGALEIAKNVIISATVFQNPKE